MPPRAKRSKKVPAGANSGPIKKVPPGGTPGQPDELIRQNQALRESVERLTRENEELARRQRETEEDSRKSKRRLEVALEAAQDAHRAKDEFIAALSHELRTPLTPILIAAELCAEDPTLPERVREQFAMVRSNVKVEAHLIDDLMDQMQIGPGANRPQKQQVDLHAIVRDSLLTVTPDFVAKGITPELHLANGRAPVEADPVRLQQIFWNLLSNAAKFTPAGGMVTIKSAKMKGGRIAVSVVDSGIGLTKAEMAGVFQPATHEDRSSGGSASPFGGLGLSISQKLIRLYLGRLTVTSGGRGQGTAFTVELPLSAHQAVPGTPSAAPRPAERPRRILLVEDHVSTRAALVLLFQRRGHDVTVAGSIAEALARAKTTKFGLVVSDLGLPDGSGHDLMRQLRSDQPDLDGIALSGFGMETDREQAHAAGFFAHLTKPVAIEQLEAVLWEIDRSRDRAG